MRDLISKIIRTVLFIAIFALLCWGYHAVFKFKTHDGPYQMMKFYEEEKNSIDVLFLGSSHMFVNANTSVLWDEYGMASYDLGGSIQPYWNTYYYLVEALKTQTPKLVVFDVFTAADVDGEYYSHENVVKNIFGMKLSKNRLDAIDASVVEENRDYYYYEYPTYHKRYVDDITKDDFIYDYEDDCYAMNCWKGETIMFTPNAMDRPSDEVIHDDTVGNISEKNEEYLRKIIDLCKVNDIPLLLVLNPYHVLDYQMPYYNRIQEIANETGTDYINFNLYYDEIGVDFEKDFTDACHMVYTGSANFSRFMGAVIKSRYDIPDRRGTAGYESYDDMLDMYNTMIRYEELKKDSDINEVVLGLVPDDSVVVCSVVGDYWQDPEYENNRNALGLLGIDISEVSGSSVWVIEDGQIIFASGNQADYSFRKRVSKYDTISICSKEVNGGVIPSIRLNSENVSKAKNGIKIFVYDKKLKNDTFDKVYRSDEVKE